jgi:hypothetical protein
VSISGNNAIDGFQSSELFFGYANNPTDTWFLITRNDQPVKDGELAQWDTTTITDGNYTLRLIVSFSDGTQSVATVPNVRVRNYSPIETDTPTPITPTATQVPGDMPISTITPTATITPKPPTPTPLPTNPAELSSANIIAGVGKGALATMGLFILLGLYITIRRAMRD